MICRFLCFFQYFLLLCSATFAGQLRDLYPPEIYSFSEMVAVVEVLKVEPGNPQLPTIPCSYNFSQMSRCRIIEILKKPFGFHVDQNQEIKIWGNFDLFFSNGANEGGKCIFFLNYAGNNEWYMPWSHLGIQRLNEDLNLDQSTQDWEDSVVSLDSFKRKLDSFQMNRPKFSFRMKVYPDWIQSYRKDTEYQYIGFQVAEPFLWVKNPDHRKNNWPNLFAQHYYAHAYIKLEPNSFEIFAKKEEIYNIDAHWKEGHLFLNWDSARPESQQKELGILLIIPGTLIFIGLISAHIFRKSQRLRQHDP